MSTSEELAYNFKSSPLMVGKQQVRIPGGLVLSSCSPLKHNFLILNQNLYNLTCPLYTCPLHTSMSHPPFSPHPHLEQLMDGGQLVGLSVPEVQLPLCISRCVWGKGAGACTNLVSGRATPIP
jgi:hypothetical protein